MTRGRIITVVIVVAALIGLVVFFAVREAPRLLSADEETQYQTAVIARGDVAFKIGSSGNASARQIAVISWKTSGEVASVAVTVGDRVEADQLLASLSPTSLSADLLQAKGQLVEAQRALDELREVQATRAEAWNAVVSAQKALNDVRAAVALLDQPNASPTNLEAAQAAYNLALSQVDAAEAMYSLVQGQPLDSVPRLQAAAQLERAYSQRDNALINLEYARGKPDDQTARRVQAELALAEANLEEAQREWERVKDGPSQEDIRAAELWIESITYNLAKASLNAPINGTVTELFIKIGDVVNSGTQAVRIDDFSERHVLVEVPEVDIVLVRPGQPAELTFDALPGREFHGEVIKVSRVGRQDAGGIHFEVEVRMTDDDDSVQPGLTAAVNVIVEERKDVVMIPNRALRRSNGQQVVYLLRDGSPVMVPVTTGLSDEDNSELLEGDLRVGDVVVLNPPANILQSNGN